MVSNFTCATTIFTSTCSWSSACKNVSRSASAAGTAAYVGGTQAAVLCLQPGPAIGPKCFASGLQRRGIYPQLP